MADPSVISFGDITLHDSDVALLEGPQWLNDNIIAFYFEYLTLDVFKEYKDNILFVHPSTMFLTAFLEDINDLKTALKDLKMTEKELIFMPINNNPDIETAGGSHWSLLVYKRERNLFAYYDSASSSNMKAVQRAAQKIWPILSEQEPLFQLQNCPQQLNGDDCGLYTLFFTEYLANEHLKKTLGTTLKIEATPHAVSALRKKIQNIVFSKVSAKSTTGLFSLKKKKKVPNE